MDEKDIIHSRCGLLQTLEQDIPLEWRMDAAGDIALALLYLHKVDMT